MPSFKFKFADGRTARVEGEDAEDAKANFNKFVYADMMRRADDKAPAEESPPPPPPAKKGWTPEQRAAQQAKDLADTKRMANPATGMPWYEKAGVGINSGLENTATGIRSLIGTATPEELQERKDREKADEHLGGWGTAGRLVGETALTLPVGGPAAKIAGKVLTKAIPAMEAVGKYGGKVLNLGAVGSGAVQGAVQEGLVGSADDEGDLGKRAVQAAKGGAAGAAIPLALKAAAFPVGVGVRAAVGAKNLIAPSEKALQERAYGGLVKSVGQEGIDDARRAMEHATPPTIPQSSAAMANSPPLAALERGARNRGNADFNAHDESVARAAWEGLQPQPGMSSDAGDVLRAQFMRNGQVTSGRGFGEAPNIVPQVRSSPLRKALADKGPHMHPDEVDMGTAIANDLAKHELQSHAHGAVTPDVSRWVDHIPMALSAVMNHKTFGLMHLAFNRAKVSAMNDLRMSNNEKVMKTIDEALLDPQKFQTMVDEVQGRILNNKPLTDAQKVMQRIAEESTHMLSRTAADKAN